MTCFRLIIVGGEKSEVKAESPEGVAGKTAPAVKLLIRRRGDSFLPPDFAINYFNYNRACWILLPHPLNCLIISSEQLTTQTFHVGRLTAKASRVCSAQSESFSALAKGWRMVLRHLMSEIRKSQLKSARQSAETPFFSFMNSAGLGADGGMELNDSVAERKIYWRKNCSRARARGINFHRLKILLIIT